MKAKLAWYNFKTGKYEYLSESPEDMSDYIPQSPAAQSLYGLYRQEGATSLDAALKVLKIAAGVKDADA